MFVKKENVFKISALQLVNFEFMYVDITSNIAYFKHKFNV